MSDDKNKTTSAAASEAAAIAKDVPTATEPRKSDAAVVAEPEAKSTNAEPAPSAPAAKSTETGSEKNQKFVAKKSESEKPSEKNDVEMKDADDPEADSALVEAAQQSEKGAAEAPAAGATPAKSKNRRKSTGGAVSSVKKLNKKASRARITHTDAQPGDHFFVKLKGHPKWPVVVCDDDMLPQNLLSTRPVSAKRADGTYGEAYVDGGKQVSGRKFPVMYLHTNEFGWVHNSDLSDLDPESLTDKTDSLRNDDLREAYKLAAKQHPLSFYKEVLEEFQADLIEQQKEQDVKAVATPAKKKKKVKAEVDETEDGDVDVDMDVEEEEDAPPKKTKKRKPEADIETPTVAKKPRIKITNSSTPKAANGVSSTSKTTKTSVDTKGAAKSAGKSKNKKPKELEEKQSQPEPAPKSPELSSEEKHQRKEKEVLFLRHRLQKGLITRDSEPKPEEMKAMSDYVSKLEAMPDLEVSIIRATKINKVLKAILKLERIPKEEEFSFKRRSQDLLDHWNKLLSADGANMAAESTSLNGDKTKPEKSDKTEKTNGVKDDAEAATAATAKTAKAEKASKTGQNAKVDDETDTAEKTEDQADKHGDAAEKHAVEAKESEAVESSA